MQSIKGSKTKLSAAFALTLLASVQALTPDSTGYDSRSPQDISSGSSRNPKLAPDAKDTIQRLREAISIAQLTDSLRTTLQQIKAKESGADIRRGRELLRTADSSLFTNHPGSVGGDYPLGPGDGLILTIWGQKQARYDLEIDRDGQVQIPAVGAVSLNGVNFKDAKGVLSRKLASAYSGIQSGLTQIDLTLAKLKQVRIFVVGDVLRPGGYVLSGTTTSLQAVSIAGGPSENGSERLVMVSRGDTSYPVDLYAYLFLGRRPRRDVLQDGDVVRVPPSLGTVRLEGAISRPGRYEVLPSESIADVVALAGGPSPDCDPEAPVRLVREHRGERTTSIVGTARQIEVAGKTVSAQPGDVVSVRPRSEARRTSPSISGFVRNPGEYPYEQGITARRLVGLAGGPSRGAMLKRVVVIRTDSVGASSILEANLELGPDLPIFPSDSVFVGGQKPSDSIVRIQLSGAVRSPGLYDWHKGMRLNDLLLLAGGTQPWADRKAVRVAERSAAGTEIRAKTLSLDTLSEQSEPYLAPYSLVSVPSTGNRPALPAQVKLTGQVKSPESYALLSAKERLSSVVLRAGGLDSTAFPDGAVIWRRSEGRIPANLAKALDRPGSVDDVILQANDSIHVPERPATVSVVGLVNHPTQVLWRKGKGWQWYVRSSGDFADSANREAVYVKYADGSIQSLDQGPMDPTPGSTVYVPRREPPRTATSTEKLSAMSSVLSALAALLMVYVIYSNSQK